MSALADARAMGLHPKLPEPTAAGCVFVYSGTAAITGIFLIASPQTSQEAKIGG